MWFELSGNLNWDKIYHRLYSKYDRSWSHKVPRKVLSKRNIYRFYKLNPNSKYHFNPLKIGI